jgi:hypothetical protein
MPRWPQHNLIALEGVFCTEGAQEMQKEEASDLVRFAFRAEKDLSAIGTVNADGTS